MASCALVISNGDLDNPHHIRARLQSLQVTLVIAVDGGSRYASELGLKPDLVLGDLDSIDPDTRRKYTYTGITFHSAPAEKDETDLELALLYAAEQGIDNIVILGAIGGRVDMTIANIMLLGHPGLSGVRVEIWHGKQTAWLIHPPGGEITGQPGDTLSLIPLGGCARGISTHHLAYPLHAEDLVEGPARGISNVLLETTARIDLQQGKLLVVHTPGTA